MIVVLCNSFRDAMDSFYAFIDSLRDSGEWQIKHVWPSEYCVETDEDLRYIFVQKEYGRFFESMRADFVDVDSFFYTLYLR